MTRKQATILMTVVGVVAFLAIVGLSLGAWFFATVFEREDADAPAATQLFDDVRRRFGETGPLFEIVDDNEAMVRRVPHAAVPARQLQTLHVMAWDPDDDGLSRVDLPFWFLRLKAGPIDFSSNVMLRGHNVDVTVEQLERYGPALLVDHEGRGGDRLLIWTE